MQRYWGWWRSQSANLMVIGVASLALSSGVAALVQLGLLEGLEQKAYDQMVRLRQATRSLPPDDRLLIVTVTEEDLETLAEFPLTDGTVARAINQLQQHEPVAIGLDMFRAIPKPPGRDALGQALQADNIVVIAQLANSTGGPGIPPPVESAPGQVSFNDVVVDADGKVRRALMIAEPTALPEHPYLFSFSLQLAMRYLATQDLMPTASPENPDYMQLGETTLWPLQSGSGGYARIDDNGYQVMLDYRDRVTPARTVTLQAVLNDQFDPAWVRGKVVLIGITAPSFKDLFYTPFTGGASDANHQMPGVILHGQMVSQWLDLALGDRPLMGLSHPWQEWLWCLGWALLGGTLAWYLHHPITLTASETGVFIAIAVSGYALFLTQGWVPIIAPALTVLGTSGVVLAYQAQQSFRQRQMMQVLLGQAASPEIARALWENRDRLIKSGKLPGQSMVATMLFTDLRGFSSLAEITPPEQLLEWLNHYLEAMTDEIQIHHGIVNKFTGDGLLAVFGVPIASTTPDEIAADAQAAVACALGMATRLQTINRERQAQHHPRLEMRVGIFTGPVVVGSVGGHQRMEYGIIGDSVNIASRLESVDKSRQPEPCRILIGQDTLDYVGDAFITEAWGDLVLKGRHAPLGVYRVIDRRTDPISPLT
ncbi:adenylate/guanylate cyclase domain-containing protein [Leptolyngbya iicbica LK]|uniref:Adenylate/guanylate cyclase domain-containing protein n=3 Tax=Cyanophyceae TaxID=3028117 RepID=A0A4Q7E7C8_9CYAN|nr:adenylate/guanylate cyclase domain-containing protein [Leptolyngbya sp. LK]